MIFTSRVFIVSVVLLILFKSTETRNYDSLSTVFFLFSDAVVKSIIKAKTFLDLMKTIKHGMSLSTFDDLILKAHCNSLID